MRYFLLFVAGWICVATGAAAAERPNFIVIVSDDHGYADIGCQGLANDIRTPNIDRIARSGIRFTQGYVSSAVCSPSRAGFMTGQYQTRFGHEFNTGPFPGPDVGLPAGQKTIADVMKHAGYVTGAIGKWHLGDDETFHPLVRGFDEFFGFLSGSRSYFDMSADHEKPLLRGREKVAEEGYLTDVLTREAVSFIDRHRSDPFFLYVAYTAPHLPLHATPQDLERFAHIPEKKRRTTAAMIWAMDRGVGEMLDKLEQSGLDKNTMVVFFADNGGYDRNDSRNGPLRGGKGQLYEGGIRVPFVMQWKAALPAGAVYERPVITLDLLPTIVAAAGAAIPDDRPVAGVNLLPYLTGKTNAMPHEALFWRYGNMAMRSGDHKLIVVGDKAELYDLAANIAESNDLAAQKPEIVRKMRAELDAWNRQNIPAPWKSQYSDEPAPKVGR